MVRRPPNKFCQIVYLVFRSGIFVIHATKENQIFCCTLSKRAQTCSWYTQETQLSRHVITSCIHITRVRNYALSKRNGAALILVGIDNTRMYYRMSSYYNLMLINTYSSVFTHAAKNFKHVKNNSSLMSTTLRTY